MTESPRYEVLAKIGSGGMGIVYKARDRDTAEIVAIKVLKPEISSDQDMLRRFKNELRLARKITHKNVCRIYDLNRFEGAFCISMELVEGESLRPVLKRLGALGVRKGIQIAQQICAGLGEAHSQGVVHRDLKPENIMLDRTGNIKIMDFGIARAAGSGATTVTGIVGTPSYMSPEQAQCIPTDARSDIYSLGLILYEIFTGVIAFRGDTPVAVALKQISETPPPPGKFEPSLPPHIQDAIMRCIEKDPAKRFQSVAELEGVLLDRTFWTPAAGDTADAEIPLPIRSEEWQRSDWTLLGAALLAIPVFFAMFYGFYPEPRPAGEPPTRLVFTGPALVLFILFLFVYRKLYLQTPSSTKLRIAAVIGVGSAVAIPVPEYAGPGSLVYKFGMPLLFFFLAFTVTYCVVTTVLYYGRRRCPIQVSRFLLFASEKFFSKPVGLDMLRGILAGLVFAGSWMALVSVGGAAGMASVGLPYFLPIDARSQGAFSLLVFAENLVIPWLLVAFPLSVLAGVLQRLPALMAALAVLWLILGFSMLGALALPQPAFEISVVFQALYCGWVFQKYGITSAGAAVLTSEVLLLAFPLFVVSSSLQHAVPIAVWVLMVITSCAIFFSPQLRAACRRLASMFE